MIVLVRLLWALLRSQFKRRLDLLDESALTMRVWPNDLDLNVHMNSGRYVSMMDIGRVELLGRMRLLHLVFGRRKWRPLAGAATIRYRRSLLPFQRFTVRTKIVCWDEKWLYYRQLIERRGELCTFGYVRMLLRGPEGNIAPARILEVVGKSGMQSPPMPDDLARWLSVELTEELR